ncbi:MAG TPA: carboxypeptidase-like regulatory domain-containing protein [Bryobacteraceae bacterium]|nr:carboxypeptidase-like regulatory domain-containing protein [Bryobacteraceae bacterium]
MRWLNRASFIVVLALSLRAGPFETTLMGQVSKHGVPVPDAIVTISNRGFLKSATTDEAGRFALQPLPPGRYSLRISAHGCAVLERNAVVHPGATNWIEVTDLLGADEQSVSVADLAAPKMARK